ncbi:MAG: hypothetical protein MPJ50_09320 [Pirellulales bacterium]|nr:hypothetical protein [Pirellulales bacterium]
MSRRLMLFCIVVVAAIAGLLKAVPFTQQPANQSAQVVEFDKMYNQRYAGQKPQEGETIPNVDVFAADGQPFALESTRGKYTVLVFGCLT